MVRCGAEIELPGNGPFAGVDEGFRDAAGKCVISIVVA